LGGLFPPPPGAGAAGGLAGLLAEPLDSGAELLSRDLLGEIDGLAPGSHQPQPPSLLHLPDSSASLFAPAAHSPAPTPPTATSTASFSAFRSLW
jgi:hypothetical protein